VRSRSVKRSSVPAHPENLNDLAVVLWSDQRDPAGARPLFERALAACWLVAKKAPPVATGGAEVEGRKCRRSLGDAGSLEGIGPTVSEPVHTCVERTPRAHPQMGLVSVVKVISY
jgi:hypothetical protein